MEKGNNSNKTLKLIGIGTLAAALFGWWARRAYKKELKKVVETREEAENEIKSLGGDPEVIREQVIEHEEESERNFIKALYVIASSKSSNFGKEQSMSDYIMNGEEYDDGLVSNRVTLDDYFVDEDVEMRRKIIHVTEEVIKGNRHLKFLLGIPEYSNGNFNKFRIQDILNALSNAGDYIFSKILKTGVVPDLKWKKAVAVLEYEYSCTDPEDTTRRIQFWEVPGWLLNKMYDDPGDKHNKAVKLTEDFADREGRAEIEKKIGEDIKSLLLANALKTESKEAKGEVDEKSISFKSIRDITLMYSMIFQEENFMTGDAGLISTTKALESIEYLLGKEQAEKACTFKLEKREETGRRVSLGEVLPKTLSHTYERVIFHAPNKDGEFDSLARYYATDTDGNMDIWHLGETGPREDDEYPQEPEPEREITAEDLHALKEAMNTKKK